MKTEYKRPVITCREDLRQYGINQLTGEACAYGMRMLCDVSEDGKALLEEYFGTQMTLHRKANNYVGDEPSIGSIMLPHEIFHPLALFIMFYVEGCDFVAYDQNAGLDIHGFMNGDEHQYAKEGDSIENTMAKAGYMIRRNTQGLGGQPFRGSRNVHAIMG